MSWVPNEKTQNLLAYAMRQIENVHYQVSARWVYYRLVQAGLLSKTKRELSVLMYAANRARKTFYKEWNPEILADSIRTCYWRGEPVTQIAIREDTLKLQPYIVQIWFEARAMLQQVAFYAEPYRVSLVPFGGEVSIPIKWQIAKKIEELSERYDKPVQVLYFGDYDKKGLSIAQSALEDIQSWCKVPFSFERVGLTLEQAQSFGLSMNPEKPDAYQWEALNDEQAGKLIVDALDRFVNPVPEEVGQREGKMEQWLTMQAGD